MRAWACRGVLLLALALSSAQTRAVELGPVTVDAREGGFFGQLRCVVQAPVEIAGQLESGIAALIFKQDTPA